MGIDDFIKTFGNQVEMDWTLKAQLEILRTPMRKWFGWAYEVGLIPLWSMQKVDLSNLDMRGANMRWANMSGADMRWANMSGADMSGADMRGADMRWADMRDCIGLDSCIKTN